VTAAFSVPSRGNRVEHRARYTGPTYYELPPVKASFWGELVAAYLYVGGVAGASQIVATLADITGAPGRITRNGRLLALGGAAAGAALLVADLRTPQRWYNMLRIWRSTSPMSIGTWVLSAFAAASAAPAAAAAIGDRQTPPARALRAVARVSQLPAAAAGAAMTVYTAPLLSATSTPLWASAPRLLAVRFGSAAMATGSAALALADRGPVDGASRVPLDRLTGIAAAVELGASLSGDARARALGIEAPSRDPALRLLGTAALAVGCGIPLVCHLLNELQSRRSPALSRLAAVAALAGGYLMRSSVLRSGNESARRAQDTFALAQPRHLPVRQDPGVPTRSVGGS